MVVAIAAAVTAVVIFSRRPHPKRLPAVKAGTASASPVPESTQAFVVEPGEVLTSLLARAGVETQAANRVVDALRSAGFDFRRLKPKDSLILGYRSDTLRRIYYRQSSERIYRIDLDAAECPVAMLYRPAEVVPALVRGSITNSLYESMLEIGETPALIADFADIFGWEIDFFTETQPNDSFAVLFERRFVDSAFVGYGQVLAARYHGSVGDFRAFRFSDPDGHTDYYNPLGQSMRKTFLRSPLSFARITSHFGRRFHPIRRIRCPHHGTDYAAPTGTPVSCVADGRVTFVGTMDGYGKLVEVSHGNGLCTRYGHLSRFGRGVRNGTQVTQNQVIGYVGSTGLSTGPHLHYEIRKSGTPLNPLKMDFPRAQPVTKAYLAQFETLKDSLTRELLRPKAP